MNIRLLPFLLLFSSYCSFAQAQDSSSLEHRLFEFDELVVTANRWQQHKDEIPGMISSISSKSVDYANPETSADILASNGGVFVQKSQLGGGSPMLRGFAANSILLMVDGVRLNNAIYRSGNLQNVLNLDINAMQSVEVIYGPGSVMYGSDALGGVVKFQTKKTSFSTTPSVSGDAFMRVGSAAKERTGHVGLAVAGRHMAYYGNFTYTALDDLRSGHHRSKGYKDNFLNEYYVTSKGQTDVLTLNTNMDVQKFSGYNLHSTIHKIGLKIGKYSLIEMGYYHSSTSDIPRYDALQETNSESDSLAYAAWYYGPQKWNLWTANLINRNRNLFFNQGKLGLSFQDYTESRNDRAFGSDFLRSRVERVRLMAINTSFEKHIGNHTLIYGVDQAFNFVTSRAEALNIRNGAKRMTSTRYPDGGSTYFTHALYTNFILRTKSHWVWNFGARYSRVILTANTKDETATHLSLGDFELSSDAVTGSMGAVYNTANSGKWSLSVSSGFRAPNVDDIGKLFELGSTITIPNRNLKPEYTYNQEIGWEHEAGAIIYALGAYHSFLHNTIVSGSMTVDGSDEMMVDGQAYRIESQINDGQGRIFGWNAQATWQFSKALSFGSQVTYTKGYLLHSREPLRHVPPLFGRASLDYAKDKWQASFWTAFNGHKRVSDIPSNEFNSKPHLYTDTGSPGWYTLNLSGSYQVLKPLKIQMGVRNILDTHYRTYSSGISAPGRNVVITARSNF